MSRLSQIVRALLRQKALLAFVAILLLYGAYVYWRSLQDYVSTDDAYVGAHVVSIAAQVSGPVARVFVHNNRPVRAHQRLFEIDPHPYQIAVLAARASVAQRQALLANAEAISGRTQRMAVHHFLSSQASETAQATVKADRAALAAAKAALARARLNLSHCLVRAPTNGYLSNMRLRPGAYIQAGTPLFALIASREYWVTANFKETSLSRVVVGDRAHIHIDMYPNQRFRGRVVGISGGSGTAFSLLPPENATGNWVKVTQRVPVRILILNPNPRWPLRIGTSATATVFFRKARKH
ncbi:HlyD family secretion protein [Acidiferrobacter thiooxydans]|jgi:membrane fusion protein (multidrug efflux system)|uniref:HlyD family secretion protein n=1 Tax=Acidiferrobacter thiooxydans TaxID=163359 RepID=A0A1C2FXD3_9GAMM|nr:HlyD family secretion protein [Acidiferrobacter thiooxydans]RCN56529.1 HlyD family secretion protein [Acidiferrobacter thiooxydans]UEN99177.1 HlyD family secretion protein [Acidiferrobacter thiooxydans]